jgi:hypothetical protein
VTCVATFTLQTVDQTDHNPQSCRCRAAAIVS